MAAFNFSFSGSICLLSCFLLWTCAAFNLTLLHTNDVHSHVQENGIYEERECGSFCYGGVARMKTIVQDIRNYFPNTLLLDAGDQFQGTLWFHHYGGNITSTTMTELGYDAMALGNHEFDLNIEGLLPFLKEVNFPVLSANINSSLEPSIAPYIKKSFIAQVGGERIGIVGYTTTDTPMISSPGSLIFNDEIESVRSEVQKLTEEGVNKIIALGHAGFEMDKRIAEIPDVDVVIGGHTHTFLYSGPPPSTEIPSGEYPHVVHKPGGERTLVVQDYAFGKYLGFLRVEFDNNGKIMSYRGHPLLLDRFIEKNTELKEKIDVLYKGIQKLAKAVVGRTLITLEGNMQCRLRECNMGNAIADSLVYHNMKESDDVNGTKVCISLLHAGSIEKSFYRGPINMDDIYVTQPHQHTFETIQLQGRYLRATLEHSASSHSLWYPDKGFLQVSGIRVKYNLNKPRNKRVVDVKVLCSDCEVPKYEPLNDNKMYGIIVSNYLISGGEGYTVLRDNAQQRYIVGTLDTDAFAAYVARMSPLYISLDGRIQFVDDDNRCGVNSGLPTTQNNFYTTLLLLLTVCYRFHSSQV